MIPQKLQSGDEIRVIAPARSLGIVSDDIRKIAIARFKEMGLKVTFSKNAEEKDEFLSSSIESRVEDLHEAFTDQNVKGIFSVIGGFNSNQLLSYIDYDLIKKNPKILCGFSDITVLANAIYAKTGLVTYLGPHFSTFGMKKGLEYTIEYFQKCLMGEGSFRIEPSKEYSDDHWFRNQEERKFIPNEGYLLINEGEAEGTIIGGNLCTLNLLQGSEYMPSLKGAILFIEDDDGFGDNFDVELDRNLQSLIHLPDFSGVRGIVIGRFEKRIAIESDRLKKIIQSKKELKGIPVISGADFGHTTPICTFPIGGKARLAAKKGAIKIEIIEG